MNPGKLLFLIFLAFAILAYFGIWLDRVMGWEHHRALQETGYSYYIEEDGQIVKYKTTKGEIYE